MPIPPADTLRVLPGAEAFPGSLLLAPDEPGAGVVRELAAWSEAPVNHLLIIFFTVLILFHLRRLVGILPYLLGGMMRWRAIPALETSIRLSRDRNAFALIMAVPFCLVASRFSLCPVRILDTPDPGIKTLLTLAVFAAYALVRQSLIRIVRPRRISSDIYRTANNSGFNFFIITTLLLVFTAGLSRIIAINELITRQILLYEILAVFVVFSIRKTQIMANACNQFTAFLYLCGLELFPAALLVVSATIF